MYFERITPEKAGVSSGKILEFLEACKSRGLELHSMMFLRHGKVYAESWWKPYNKNSPHAMFSFTKSLTSTAVGFAVQEGLMSLSDRLVDIFPEYLPEEVSENLSKCTIRDLLVMGCGHHTEPNAWGEDWIKKFLSHPFEHDPGTYFVYNSSGTNMLCAAIKRRTGLHMIEFLKPRLFDKIGMGDVICSKMHDGTDMGGGGSKLTTEQMALFIQFVMNKGKWEGAELLNEAWFDSALSKQIDNKHSNSIADWTLGYGYQFWMCEPEGVVRADGAYGQFGIMCPKEGAIFILSGSSTNNFQLLQTVWLVLLPALSDSELPEDNEANAVLNYVLENNEITPLYSARVLGSQKKYTKLRYAPADEGLSGGLSALCGGYGLAARIFGEPIKNTIKKLYTEFTDTEFILTAETENGTERLPISLTSHFNSFLLDNAVHGAVGRWLTPESFMFLFYCAENPNGSCVTITFSDTGLKFTAAPTYPDERMPKELKGDINFTLIN